MSPGSRPLRRAATVAVAAGAVGLTLAGAPGGAGASASRVAAPGSSAAGASTASSAGVSSASGAEPGVASAARSAAATVDPYRRTARRATVAHVVHPTGVRSGPGTGRTTQRLGTATAWGGGPVRLLVLRSAVDVEGRRWLQVRLPDRPNDREGWILRDRTAISSTPWRIVVSRSKRTLAVLRAGRLVRRVSVVVGARATPTPVGSFAVSEAIRQTRGNLGPWAIHLTAHSDVLDDYGGGPGRIALHGRTGPLLRDPLGSARSHGCVRMDNAFLRWLVPRATAGTPVDVRR
jgi:lipoprotein-anchoring transpeptidase ErfK/SrfK